MNCSLCNSKTRHKKKDYVHKSKIIGEVLVPAIELRECRGCGNIKLSSEACDEVRNYVAEQEQNAIATLPADGLISAGQAAAILEVTKQAFSKNSKLKRGFVYSVMIGEKRAYFRSSVELFKKTGDGRFLITGWKPSVPKNAVCTYAPVGKKWQKVFCQTAIAAEFTHSWNETTRVK